MHAGYVCRFSTMKRGFSGACLASHSCQGTRNTVLCAKPCIVPSEAGSWSQSSMGDPSVQLGSGCFFGDQYTVPAVCKEPCFAGTSDAISLNISYCGRLDLKG